MGDRLTAHIRSLQAVRWDIPQTEPKINDYMELLVKETVTLHKVLSRYLSVAVVEVTQYFYLPFQRINQILVCDVTGFRGH
jgi:vacuolar protein sorting-associated protein 54